MKNDSKRRVGKIDIVKSYGRVLLRRSIHKNLYRILGLKDFI